MFWWRPSPTALRGRSHPIAARFVMLPKLAGKSGTLTGRGRSPSTISAWPKPRLKPSELLLPPTVPLAMRQTVNVIFCQNWRRPMRRFLMLGPLAFLVTGCVSSTPPVVRTEIVRPAVPAEARKPCDPPARLPGRALTQEEVARLWGRDRSSLRTCEQRRAAAVGAS